MAVMVLIVGLPGAGKTSWVRRLEDEHKGVRLTSDEWMQALFDTFEVDGRRWVLESELLWGIAARALELGVDAILDYGCWSEEERELFRTQAQQAGASAEIVVLDLPLDALWERLERRNADLPPAMFPVSREELREWSASFQVPTAEELQRWDRHLVVTS